MRRLADPSQVLAQRLRGKLSIQHFLKSAKPQDIFYLKTERQPMPLDDKLQRKLKLPECIDVSMLDDKLIDMGMMAAVFDVGLQRITSDFGDADEDLENAFANPPGSPSAETVGTQCNLCSRSATSSPTRSAMASKVPTSLYTSGRPSPWMMRRISLS